MKYNNNTRFIKFMVNNNDVDGDENVVNNSIEMVEQPKDEK